MTFDPLAQSEALIEELRELRASANKFNWGDDPRHRAEFEETFEFALSQAVTAKVIGEHPEILLSEEERTRLSSSGYELAVTIREMREGLDFLRERLPQHFQT